MEGKGKKEGNGDGSDFEDLKQILSSRFKRAASNRWPYEEERLLAAVCQREAPCRELSEIFDYYAKPDSHPRQSILALLENWQGELDKSRTYDANRRQNGPTVWRQIEDLEERISKHPANSQSTFHKRDATPEQKKELSDMRTRLSKLKSGQ